VVDAVIQAATFRAGHDLGRNRTPGFTNLASGRVVYDTGKVFIGLRYCPAKPQPFSADAEIIQDALLLARRDEYHEAFETGKARFQ
jgi:hypothetical protein